MKLFELMNCYSSIYGNVSTAPDVAKRYLRLRLFDGPVGATKILRTARIKGISQSTLRRAKKELGVVARKNGALNEVGQSTWQWELPQLVARRLATPLQPPCPPP
jgi:hypothetical protein